MKIKEIICEETPSTDKKDFVDSIRVNCSKYLSIVPPDPYNQLWRGISKSANINSISLQPCPVNRKPTATNHVTHEIIDNWFLTTLGIRFRSNSIFVSGSQNMAEDYGRAFIALPIGDFQFCWSPRIIDLTYDLLRQTTFPSNINCKPDLSEENPCSDDPVKNQYLLEKALKQAKYQTTNFRKAMQSEHEIMLHNSAGCYLIHANLVDTILEMI